MDRERYRRIRKIFDSALALPQAKRSRFLADACGDDEDLRIEVERLLGQALADEATDRVEPKPEDGDRDIDGRRIGPYRIVRRIGQGGMGIVYEALQEDPVRRTVALKLIKHDLDGQVVLSRFDAERQALAMMNHPNLARVLDAGSDDYGRPYFVMEYIDGPSITEYCDRHRLSTRGRIDLMIQVCEGVQHAHQKGIIHRDLKPSNILVETQGGKPIPRVIDFGVAKAVDWSVAERSLLTDHGQIVGTPEYMSPEQADGAGQDVDTRTDVYALGVVLYEVLIGELPFSSQELREAGFEEMRHRIREATPLRPSARLQSLGDRSQEIARRRSSDVAALERSCRGELDWITMKALEKDRGRRYASPSDLAMDLGRHVRNEPVAAGPPSIAYRARKYVRRHRVAVAFAAVLLVAIVTGVAGTVTELARALRAERQMRLEAATAQAVSDFLLSLFEINDPGEARGRSVTAKEVLDRGATKIATGLSSDQELYARLSEEIGKVYRSLGLYDDSQPLLERAVEGQSLAHGPGSPETARTQTTLAGLLILRGKYEEAIAVLEKALPVQERSLPPTDPELARTLSNLGNAYRGLKRYDQALPPLERALAIREHALGPDHPDVAKQLGNLGSVRERLGDLPGARRDLERALAIYERLNGPDHVTVARALDNLAMLYRDSKNLPGAKAAAERALAIEEKALGPENPDLVNTLIALGMIARDQGDLAHSETSLRRALAIATAKVEPGHRDRKQAREELAATLEAEGKLAEADSLGE